MIRTCTGCGYIAEEGNESTKCPKCKAFFDQQYCSSCKEIFPLDTFHVRSNGALTRRCKACNRKASKANHKKHRARKTATDRAWLEAKREMVNKNYDKWYIDSKECTTRLTTEDWNKICTHFDGCALCDNVLIETRHFIIPYQEGGRYTKFNVIPLCMDCTRVAQKSYNLYKKLMMYHLHKDEQEVLIKYLYSQLEEAKNEQAKQD